MTSQLAGLLASQPNDQSASWKVSQLASQLVGQLAIQPIDQSASWSVSYSTIQPFVYSAIWSFSHAASQYLAHRPVTQPLGQPVGHSAAHVQYQLADRSLLVAVETALWAGSSRVGTYNDVGGLGRGRIKPLRRTSSLH